MYLLPDLNATAQNIDDNDTVILTKNDKQSNNITATTTNNHSKEEGVVSYNVLLHADTTPLPPSKTRDQIGPPNLKIDSTRDKRRKKIKNGPRNTGIKVAIHETNKTSIIGPSRHKGVANIKSYSNHNGEPHEIELSKKRVSHKRHHHLKMQTKKVGSFNETLKGSKPDLNYTSGNRTNTSRIDFIHDKAHAKTASQGRAYQGKPKLSYDDVQENSKIIKEATRLLVTRNNSLQTAPKDSKAERAAKHLLAFGKTTLNIAKCLNNYSSECLKQGDSKKNEIIHKFFTLHSDDTRVRLAHRLAEIGRAAMSKGNKLQTGGNGLFVNEESLQSLVGNKNENDNRKKVKLVKHIAGNEKKDAVKHVPKHETVRINTDINKGATKHHHVALDKTENSATNGSDHGTFAGYNATVRTSAGQIKSSNDEERKFNTARSRDKVFDPGQAADANESYASHLQRALQNAVPTYHKTALCSHGHKHRNVIPRYGLHSGLIVLHGIVNLDRCIKYCCASDTCDLALLVRKECFTVTCKSAFHCQFVPNRGHRRTEAVRIYRGKMRYKASLDSRHEGYKSFENKTLRHFQKGRKVREHHTKHQLVAAEPSSSGVTNSFVTSMTKKHHIVTARKLSLHTNKSSVYNSSIGLDGSHISYGAALSHISHKSSGDDNQNMQMTSRPLPTHHQPTSIINSTETKARSASTGSLPVHTSKNFTTAANISLKTRHGSSAMSHYNNSILLNFYAKPNDITENYESVLSSGNKTTVPVSSNQQGVSQDASRKLDNAKPFRKVAVADKSSEKQKPNKKLDSKGRKVSKQVKGLKNAPKLSHAKSFTNMISKFMRPHPSPQPEQLESLIHAKMASPFRNENSTAVVESKLSNHDNEGKDGLIDRPKIEVLNVNMIKAKHQFRHTRKGHLAQLSEAKNVNDTNSGLEKTVTTMQTLKPMTQNIQPMNRTINEVDSIALGPMANNGSTIARNGYSYAAKPFPAINGSKRGQVSMSSSTRWGFKDELKYRNLILRRKSLSLKRNTTANGTTMISAKPASLSILNRNSTQSNATSLTYVTSLNPDSAGRSAKNVSQNNNQSPFPRIDQNQLPHVNVDSSDVSDGINFETVKPSQHHHGARKHVTTGPKQTKNRTMSHTPEHFVKRPQWNTVSPLVKPLGANQSTEGNGISKKGSGNSASTTKRQSSTPVHWFKNIINPTNRFHHNAANHTKSVSYINTMRYEKQQSDENQNDSFSKPLTALELIENEKENSTGYVSEPPSSSTKHRNNETFATVSFPLIVFPPPTRHPTKTSSSTTKQELPTTPTRGKTSTERQILNTPTTAQQTTVWKPSEATRKQIIKVMFPRPQVFLPSKKPNATNLTVDLTMQPTNASLTNSNTTNQYRIDGPKASGVFISNEVNSTGRQGPTKKQKIPVFVSTQSIHGKYSEHKTGKLLNTTVRNPTKHKLRNYAVKMHEKANNRVAPLFKPTAPQKVETASVNGNSHAKQAVNADAVKINEEASNQDITFVSPSAKPTSHQKGKTAIVNDKGPAQQTVNLGRFHEDFKTVHTPTVRQKHQSKKRIPFQTSQKPTRFTEMLASFPTNTNASVGRKLSTGLTPKNASKAGRNDTNVDVKPIKQHHTNIAVSRGSWEINQSMLKAANLSTVDLSANHVLKTVANATKSPVEHSNERPPNLTDLATIANGNKSKGHEIAVKRPDEDKGAMFVPKDSRNVAKTRNESLVTNATKVSSRPRNSTPSSLIQTQKKKEEQSHAALVNETEMVKNLIEDLSWNSSSLENVSKIQERNLGHLNDSTTQSKLIDIDTKLSSMYKHPVRESPTYKPLTADINVIALKHSMSAHRIVNTTKSANSKHKFLTLLNDIGIRKTSFSTTRAQQYGSKASFKQEAPGNSSTYQSYNIPTRGVRVNHKAGFTKRPSHLTTAKITSIISTEPNHTIQDVIQKNNASEYRQAQSNQTSDDTSKGKGLSRFAGNETSVSNKTSNQKYIRTPYRLNEFYPWRNYKHPTSKKTSKPTFRSNNSTINPFSYKRLFWKGVPGQSPYWQQYENLARNLTGNVTPKPRKNHLNGIKNSANITKNAAKKHGKSLKDTKLPSVDNTKMKTNEFTPYNESFISSKPLDANATTSIFITSNSDNQKLVPMNESKSFAANDSIVEFTDLARNQSLNNDSITTKHKSKYVQSSSHVKIHTATHHNIKAERRPDNLNNQTNHSRFNHDALALNHSLIKQNRSHLRTENGSKRVYSKGRLGNLTSDPHLSLATTENTTARAVVNEMTKLNKTEQFLNTVHKKLHPDITIRVHYRLGRKGHKKHKRPKSTSKPPAHKSKAPDLIRVFYKVGHHMQQTPAISGLQRDLSAAKTKTLSSIRKTPDTIRVYYKTHGYGHQKKVSNFTDGNHYDTSNNENKTNSANLTEYYGIQKLYMPRYSDDKTVVSTTPSFKEAPTKPIHTIANPTRGAAKHGPVGTTMIDADVSTISSLKQESQVEVNDLSDNDINTPTNKYVIYVPQESLNVESSPPNTDNRVEHRPKPAKTSAGAKKSFHNKESDNDISVTPKNSFHRKSTDSKHCNLIGIYIDKMLRDGANAGNFYPVLFVKDPVHCHRKCCADRRCNFAMFYRDFCYLVECFSKRSCELVHSKSATKYPHLLAKIREPETRSLSSIYKTPPEVGLTHVPTMYIQPKSAQTVAGEKRQSKTKKEKLLDLFHSLLRQLENRHPTSKREYVKGKPRIESANKDSRITFQNNTSNNTLHNNTITMHQSALYTEKLPLSVNLTSHQSASRGEQSQLSANLTLHQSAMLNKPSPLFAKPFFGMPLNRSVSQSANQSSQNNDDSYLTDYLNQTFANVSKPFRPMPLPKPEIASIKPTATHPTLHVALSQLSTSEIKKIVTELAKQLSKINLKLKDVLPELKYVLSHSRSRLASAKNVSKTIFDAIKNLRTKELARKVSKISGNSVMAHKSYNITKIHQVSDDRPKTVFNKASSRNSENNKRVQKQELKASKTAEKLIGSVKHVGKPKISDNGRLTCIITSVRGGATLFGGPRSGVFTSHGGGLNLDECIQRCCTADNCHVALLVAGHCYTVKCYTAKLCRVVPMKRAGHYLMTVAYVRTSITYSTGKQGKLHTAIADNMLPSNAIVCSESVVYEGFTLKGGYDAGHFSYKGEVGTLTDCVELCCNANFCDLVFMVTDQCYLVYCYGKDACQHVKAYHGVLYRTRIVYLHSRQRIIPPWAPNNIELRGVINGMQKSFDHIDADAKNSKPETKKRPQLAIQAKPVPLNPIQYHATPSPAQSESLKSCLRAKILTQSKLAAGHRAGKLLFRRRKKTDEDCVKDCCLNQKCNAALIVKDYCFNIICKSKKACKPVKATNSKYSVRLAVVRKTILPVNGKFVIVLR